MAYLGNVPAEKYISFERQVFTIVNSQTAYTLSHSVTNENDIRLVVNNIVQEPGSGKAYTASGTTLTLSAALVNGTDEMYCVFLGRAVGTVNPPAASVGSTQLASEAVTNAKVASTVITGQTAETTVADDDLVLLSDTSASAALKKMTVANLTANAGHPSITDNGNATAITIDSNENVGIGISPTPPTGYNGLHIHSTYPVMKLSSSATGSGTGDGFALRIDSTPRTELWNFENTDMVFATNNTARMYIDSAGRVAIGSTTVTGSRLYVPADGQTTDAWVRHGITSSCSGNWGGSKQIQVDWQILHSVSYVLEFLTASYGSRKHFVVGSYYPGSSHQTIMTDNGTGTMTQGGASSGERWTSSGGTHGVYCVRITSAQGLDNALVTLI